MLDTDPRPASFALEGKPSSGSMCFPGSTEVRMASGHNRRIAEVCVGDTLRSFDFAHGLPATSTVIDTLVGLTDRQITLNRRLTASPAQTILTTIGCLSFEQIRPGHELLLYPDLRPTRVVQVDEVLAECKVYNLVLAPFACFFVQDLLVEDQFGLDEGIFIASYKSISTQTS